MTTLGEAWETHADLDSFRYTDVEHRNGLRMTFESQHRPLSSYFDALQAACLVVEALREPKNPSNESWSRLPLFLHLRARKRA